MYHVAHPLGVVKVIGLILGLEHVLAKDVKDCTYFCCDINSMSRGNAWAKTGATHYHVYTVRTSSKGRTIKRFFFVVEI